MIFWLGTYTPPRILFDFGFVQIYWYGVIVVSAVGIAFFLTRLRWLKTHTSDSDFIDIAFYSIISGLISARLWHVFVFQWEYYSQHLAEIFKIWEGGIAIQGVIVGGFICFLILSKMKKVNVWYLTDITVIGLTLGQAIGRWGNFFNQELYGLPTTVPWGIYIDEMNRVPGFEHYSYFHPTFLYESILNVCLFIMLWVLVKKLRVRGSVTVLYLLGYGIIRFVVDFIRIDPMPMIGQLRLSQIISLLFIIFGIVLWLSYIRPQQLKEVAKL